jgi:hypothetical protein
MENIPMAMQTSQRMIELTIAEITDVKMLLANLHVSNSVDRK